MVNINWTRKNKKHDLLLYISVKSIFICSAQIPSLFLGHYLSWYPFVCIGMWRTPFSSRFVQIHIGYFSKLAMYDKSIFRKLDSVSHHGDRRLIAPHYSDVEMSAMAGTNNQSHDYLLNRLFRPRSKKTSKLRVFVRPLCGEFTSDRWLSRTNGQWRGKWFHLMTSPCIIVNVKWTAQQKIYFVVN